MLTQITHSEIFDSELQLRPGLSDRCIEVLQHLEAQANVPIPSNQLDLRTHYINRITHIAQAYNLIYEEIYELFDKSYKESVYETQDRNFVNELIQELGYNISRGGKHKTRRSMRKNKRRM